MAEGARVSRAPSAQSQALQRTRPVRRGGPGRPKQRTHDDVRHGTTTLFAALEVATGRVVDQCQPRHRHQEFLRFLKLVARTYPQRRLHVICDNYATHNRERIRAWLAEHPRITLHFTPTSARWLNLVEVFFATIDAKPCAAATSPAPHRRNQPVLRWLEPALRAVHLDKARRRDPDQVQQTKHFSYEPLVTAEITS